MTEIVQLPQLDDLTVPDDVFQEIVAEQLSAKLGIAFPHQKHNLSIRLKELEIDDNLQKKLFNRGFRFESTRHRTNLHMSYKHVDWWLTDNSIELNARWHAVPEGVNVILGTKPLGGDGSLVEDTELHRSLKETGIELHHVSEKLLENNGNLTFSWVELGMEASMPMESFYQKFVSSFDGHVAQFLEELVRHRYLSPFNPSPMSFRTDPGDLLPCKMIIDRRIPASAYERLSERWLEQIYAFGETYLPKRPN